ncbi:MBL fold metallo-hydrolase [Dehalobacterium formicoaceticum]|uniref:MBL fold metallo-hydrolase n=1 Tax=Dehalobacterium formicoaceticum TaxID=51515 RepID=UPI0031F6716B
MINITMMDYFDCGQAGKTCGYLIEGDHLTLVETGPGPAGEIILNTLKSKGYTPSDLKYVIVTHIHLDHAGSAGWLLNQCPNARLLVHPAGARHMADPSRLIAGAKIAYGDAYEFYEPVLPIAPERIWALEDESSLDLGERTLTFYHGKGHANHHLTIMDSLTNGLFCGDLLGVYNTELALYGIEYSLLPSAPNQFDPQAYRQSLEKIRRLRTEQLYFSHFGVKKNLTNEYLDTTLRNLDLFCALTEEAFAKGATTWQEIYDLMEVKIKDVLEELGWPKDKPLPSMYPSTIEVSAKGLVDWWTKYH